MLVYNRSDDVPEHLLQQHRDVVIQWLDELLQDNISVTALVFLMSSVNNLTSVTYLKINGLNYTNSPGIIKVFAFIY